VVSFSEQTVVSMTSQCHGTTHFVTDRIPVDNFQPVRLAIETEISAIDDMSLANDMPPTVENVLPVHVHSEYVSAIPAASLSRAIVEQSEDSSVALLENDTFPIVLHQSDDAPPVNIENVSSDVPMHAEDVPAFSTLNISHAVVGPSLDMPSALIENISTQVEYVSPNPIIKPNPIATLEDKVCSSADREESSNELLRNLEIKFPVVQPTSPVISHRPYVSDKLENSNSSVFDANRSVTTIPHHPILYD